MKHSAILPALLSIAFAGSLHASLQSDIGFTELKQQFGSTLPTGANLSVLVVEAPDGSGNWAVSKSGELSTRKITFPFSTTTPTGYSTHANYVAKNLTGVTTSILPELGELQVASIATYRSKSIHMGTFSSPETATWDVENHSLISNVTTYNLNALWLLDYRIARDNVTVVVALENGTSSMQPLWGNNYNTIAVGTATGQHSRGGTNLDGSGRQKPDLVGTATYTSYATPVVTSAAGLLIAEAKRTPALAAAKDPRAVKALLMAGATKEEFPAWSHTASQPLDPIYGAGQVNIYNSYVALVSGRVAAGATMDTTSGWDLGTSAKNGTSYKFTVPSGQTMKLSTALCWYREISTSDFWTFTSSLTDLNLRVRNVDTGNVVSESRSTLDNVEHIYVATLASGNYALEVVGNAGTTYGLAWYGSLSGGSTTPTTPIAAPAITLQPVSLNVDAGQPASFSVAANGDSLTYQWCHDGANIAGATSSTYSITSATTSCAGKYCVSVTNSAGSVSSTEVALTVNSITTSVSSSTDSTTTTSAISASAENAPNEGAANLVDGKTATKWLAFSANTWVQVALPAAAPLSSYSFTSANDYYQRDPYNWTVSGSNDGANWTVVDTRSAEVFASRFLKRDFALASASASYRYYRFTITARSGSITQLAELAIRTGTATTTDSSTNVDQQPVASDTTIAELSPLASTARGEFAPREIVGNLFDHNTATKWLDFSGNTWIRVELATAAPLASYSLTSANDYYQRDPYNWTVSGSNDGVTWTVVDTRSAEVFATRLLQRDFVLAAPSAAYRYYRFDIACRSGSITQLAELELWSGAVSATTSTTTTVDTSSAESASTLVEFTPAAISVRGEFAPKEVATNLFDGSTSTKWLDFSGNTWVQVELAQARQLESYSLTSANDYYQRDPYNWTVYGSNDGATWTQIDARSAEVFATRLLQRDFVLNQASASYRFFRFEITARSGSITQLAELELWGR